MKSTVASIACLAITVFALGCITTEPATPTTTLPPVTVTTLPTVSTLPPEVQAEVNTFKNAVNTNKPDDCDKIEPNLKDLCYRQLGMKNNDPELCAKISDSQQKDMCYGRIAITKKDKAICAKISAPAARSGCESKAGA
jgi:hypothetical protein